jgi:tRNA(fMet)-specific endonuclease VapC
VGLVLDSPVLIAAERSGKNARSVIEDLAATSGDAAAVISVVTVIELSHGIERANSVKRRAVRQEFLDELLQEIVVEPVTIPIARLAGKIDGELGARGSRVALSDLLIGATALHLGFGVVTYNARHFETISGLEVKKL